MTARAYLFRDCYELHMGNELSTVTGNANTNLVILGFELRSASREVGVLRLAGARTTAKSVMVHEPTNLTYTH